MSISVMIRIHRDKPDHKIRHISIVLFSFESDILLWRMRVID